MQVSHTGARGILVMPIRGAAIRAINKDAKAITLGGDYGADAIIRKIQPLSMDEILEDEDEDSAATGGDAKSTSTKSKPKKAASSEVETVEREAPQIDVRGVLDGYVITSYSAKRAIVAGPGGSRVVFDGEQAVIGGILWEISLRPSAIEFRNGTQKVLLLFDKSLSSVNVLSTQSSDGAAAQVTSSPTSGTSGSTTSSSTATSQ